VNRPSPPPDDLAVAVQTAQPHVPQRVRRKIRLEQLAVGEHREPALIRADLDTRGIDQLARGDDVVEDTEDPRCINGPPLSATMDRWGTRRLLRRARSQPPGARVHLISGAVTIPIEVIIGPAQTPSSVSSMASAT
jgi:hypothetical protein